MKKFQSLESTHSLASSGWNLLLAVFIAASAAVAGDMVKIPGGELVPLQVTQAKISVPAFQLDRHPVNNRDYLEFVRANPQWRKSAVKRIFADDAYLKSWPTDLDHGAGGERKPVTYVSWFAARAYASWAGKRLPTTVEWEYAAAASAKIADARSDTNFVKDILAWYSRPVPNVLGDNGSTFTNFYGVADLHGLVWEWVNDFNSVLVTGESREDSGLNRGLFCGAGSAGFSDLKDYAAFMRFAFRSSLRGNYCIKNLGFRCAKDVEKQP